MNPGVVSGNEGNPPDKSHASVQFKDVHVEPWPDGGKIRVHVELTPFVERPNLEVSILDKDGVEISNASIIETMVRKLVFTMHLRTSQRLGPFTLVAKLVFPSQSPVDERQVKFELPTRA